MYLPNDISTVELNPKREQKTKAKQSKNKTQHPTIAISGTPKLSVQ
jgi:hypothetical protein